MSPKLRDTPIISRQNHCEAKETGERITRCGFVAVVGASNVGKSTLVNRIVGAKVTIVSPKVQTTRSRVLGIVISGDTQIIVVDTPGIFVPRRRLDRAMVSAAWNGVWDADDVLLMIDSAKGLDSDTCRILERFKNAQRQCFIVLNKVDLVNKPVLLTLAERLSFEKSCTNVFMVSALTGDGVEDLVSFLAIRLPKGPWLYPEDQISDMPNRLLAAEITREKIYHELRNELPYAAAVETEKWTERKDGSARIDQIVYVERSSQKAIVIGKGGRSIKRIGEQARSELQEILERPVHLFLFVKVREKWADDPDRFRDFNLDFGAQ
jgi:GTP-binding protein Era